MVSLADLYTPLQSKTFVEESAVKLLLEYLSNNAEVQDEILHGHCILSIKMVRNAQSDLDCWLLSCSTMTVQLKLCIFTSVLNA